MNPKLRILIGDDDLNLLATMGDIFKVIGFAPIPVRTGRAALAQIEQQSIDVALIDLKLEHMSGLDVLRSIKARSPDSECILFTGHASQGSAIEAINNGTHPPRRTPARYRQNGRP